MFNKLIGFLLIVLILTFVGCGAYINKFTPSNIPINMHPAIKTNSEINKE